MTVTMENDGTGLFIVVDGVKIAERVGGKWVSLKPGYRVTGGDKRNPELRIETEGGVHRVIGEGE
jgi:hypothetical protein